MMKHIKERELQSMKMSATKMPNPVAFPSLSNNFITPFHFNITVYE